MVGRKPQLSGTPQSAHCSSSPQQRARRDHEQWQRGEITVMSMAVGRPRDHEGTKMSAGWAEESGTNDGTSRLGERATD